MLSYDELLQKYKLLEQENKILKEQIAKLQGKKYTSARNSESTIADFSDSKVTMKSTPKEKIKLFRSFFCGREDVFARRWYSTTTQKSGYQPVCGNEWSQDLCDKKKYKCAACPNRKLLPLTDNDFYKHLAGKDAYARDVIGIYPMLTDETCFFLCADFDEEKYEEDVTAFREICAEYCVPIAVERSRSGQGAHVWIFFDEPILAADARKIGSGLLSKAMEKRSELSFKSYDRFLPNQDTMPKGGFGNLIALPLQGLARRKGNSLFVDEHFRPFADQWAFLSSVKKLEKEKAEILVSEFTKFGELGVLIEDNEEAKPWESQAKENVISDDFPEFVNVIKPPLSAKLLLRLI